ncbi:hypothetical protein [Yoonia sp. 1_MG-2023]|nr:hypothetical protein [Yoonia sp. 1_MG-2023]
MSDDTHKVKQKQAINYGIGTVLRVEDRRRTVYFADHLDGTIKG